jgi:hypothetical protein
MSGSDKKKGDLKKKIVHEVVEFWIIAGYLTLMFAAFTQYRRLILAAHDISYTNYGIAVIEALILGKVIMIGDALHLGRGLERKPLIYPTLYKTVVFTLFLAAFTLGEHMVKGLWHGKGLTGGLIDFFVNGPHEFIGNCLVVFVALIPFFGLREMGRVFGRDKMVDLFFRRGAVQGPGSPGPGGV